MIFHLNWLNKAVLLRNTDNRIIKISNGISTIVTRVLECLRVMPEKLLSESGTKSKVWNYFGLQKGADGKPLDIGSAVCRTCHAHVKTKYSNTSNLMAHLKTKHPSLLYQEAMKSRKTPRIKSTTLPPVAQSTIQESIECAQKYEQKGKKWKELTDSITHCITKDCLPINVVEGDGFKKMINAFDLRYEILGGNHFQE